MEYLVEGKKYILSYRELREYYLLFCEKTDDEFKTELPAALHLAVVICFLKEIPSYVCLSDRGIIHELCHLLHMPDEKTTDIAEVRKLFKEQLLLS